jgi:hypothetical protein
MKIEKKKVENRGWLPTAGLGVAGPLLWEWSGHPQKAKKKKQKMGIGLSGVVWTTPKKPNTHFSFFFSSLGLLGVVEPPP